MLLQSIYLAMVLIDILKINDVTPYLIVYYNNVYTNMGQWTMVRWVGLTNSSGVKTAAQTSNWIENYVLQAWLAGSMQL